MHLSKAILNLLQLSPQNTILDLTKLSLWKALEGLCQANVKSLLLRQHCDSPGNHNAVCWVFYFHFPVCLMNSRNETPHNTAELLLPWLYCLTECYGQIAAVLENIWATMCLSSPTKRHLGESVQSHLGQNLLVQAAAPHSHRCCLLGMLSCAIQETLSASSSLHAKSKWVRAPSTGGVFFPPPSETLHSRQGGKPHHNSPGAVPCLLEAEGVGCGWQDSKVTHSDFLFYAVLQDSSSCFSWPCGVFSTSLSQDASFSAVFASLPSFFLCFRFFFFFCC